jgi:hypothetical protein
MTGEIDVPLAGSASSGTQYPIRVQAISPPGIEIGLSGATLLYAALGAAAIPSGQARRRWNPWTGHVV